jgi:hypothetical protein
MTGYWVIGGEYEDTGFAKPAPGTKEQRHGPFATYAEAKAKWQELAWSTVDSAQTRFRIEEQKTPEKRDYWVVGGRYKDTKFHEPEGGEEQWFGPFASYDEAKAEWQKRAWSTVDDALSRYRIEHVSGDPRRAKSA